MDLSDLQIFSAVVREGGVTRAAERLHRVQSNVTTRIRQLEEDLAVALFIREGKRLHLAPAGQVLLDYAERLLALADEARGAVQDAQNRAGRSGLARWRARRPSGCRGCSANTTGGIPGSFWNCAPATRRFWGAPSWRRTRRRLVAEPIADAPFEKTFAFDEELVIVAAANHPPIGKKGSLPRTIIVFEHGCPHRKRLEDWYASRREMPERTIELASYHAMLGCVVAGMGIALLPKGAF